MQGIGDTGVDIFFREAQLQWEELFPFDDKNSLKLAKEHGYPSKNAKELAEFVGNDRSALSPSVPLSDFSFAI